MARSIYIASPGAGTGKSTVALGLVGSLTKVVAKVGVFRPFVDSREAEKWVQCEPNEMKRQPSSM